VALPDLGNLMSVTALASSCPPPNRRQAHPDPFDRFSEWSHEPWQIPSAIFGMFNCGLFLSPSVVLSQLYQRTATNRRVGDMTSGLLSLDRVVIQRKAAPPSEPVGHRILRLCA